MPPQQPRSPESRTHATRRFSRRKKLAFALASLLLVLLLAEASLRLLCAVSPRVANALAGSAEASPTAAPVVPAVPDEQLQHRPNPDAPGHDARGFRNAQAAARADLVALGDSQTYGVGVEAAESWPRQVAAVTGLDTYNMAFGGYGPTHSLALADEALLLQPRIVVEAFYAGNDLWDCYHMVYARGRLPELKAGDAKVLQQISQAESADPLHRRIAAMTKVLEGDFEAINGELSAEETARFWQAAEALQPAPHPLWSFCVRNSRLCGLARETGRILSRKTPGEAAGEWEFLKLRAGVSGGLWQVCERNAVGTILVPRYRLCGLDLADVRIREGHRIALQAVRQIDSRAKGENARFAVLLIPTKERVFAEAIEPNDASTDLAALVANERRMADETNKALSEANIPVIDALPALVRCVRQGLQPYPRNPDGHPNAVGQRALADSVADFLDRSGWSAESNGAGEDRAE